MAILPLANPRRWLASAALAAGLCIGAMAPVPAHANEDDLVRVLVDIADVVIRGGHPYYRYGNHGYDDRLYVQRDRYGRPVYYRMVPRHDYGYGNRYDNRNVRCDRKGRCRVEYYDPRYDRRHYGHDRRYYGHDRRGDRYWDGRRWRHDDD